MPMRKVARKSLHWSRGLPPGHVLDASDLICLRPGDGLPPGQIERLVGNCLLREVKPGAMVMIDDIETESGS